MITCYMNVILHTLAHISPFRDYFLREDNYPSITPPPGDQTFTLGKRNNIIQGYIKGWGHHVMFPLGLSSPPRIWSLISIGLYIFFVSTLTCYWGEAPLVQVVFVCACLFVVCLFVCLPGWSPLIIRFRSNAVSNNNIRKHV